MLISASIAAPKLFFSLSLSLSLSVVVYFGRLLGAAQLKAGQHTFPEPFSDIFSFSHFSSFQTKNKKIPYIWDKSGNLRLILKIFFQLDIFLVTH